MALTGDAPVTICETSLVRGAAWDSDGRIFFGQSRGALLQVSVSDGVESPLTTLDAAQGETSHQWPQLLPGGRLLYWVRSQKPERTGTYVSSIARPADRVRVLGTDHPQTKIVRGNLADARQHPQ